jgi:glutathione reductase (NADPH)
MSKSSNHYDYFVIGAGSGGVRSARIAAGHGAKVGIAEARHFGGTCVNVGCVPKKLLSYASDYHAHFEDSQGYGWNLSSEPKFDWALLRDNKDKEINRLNDIYIKLLKNAGVANHNSRQNLNRHRWQTKNARY